MKIIAIGDIHGKDCWKQINPTRYDKVVFVGDYVDSFTKTDEQILTNLEAILALKQQEPEKVVLLLGNHDVQYLDTGLFVCAGYRPHLQPQLHAIFDENRKHFQIAYQVGKHIFTHAGITNQWHEYYAPALETVSNRFGGLNTLADILNATQETTMRIILHTRSPARGGPKGCVSGPTWADLEELRADPLTGYHQIVGHSSVPDITTFGDDTASVTFIDVLGKQTKFHEIKLTQTTNHTSHS